MTLEEKAKEYCRRKNYTPSNIGYFPAEYCEQSYIDSAKENGIVWHDLRKDKNDLPKNSPYFSGESVRVIGAVPLSEDKYISLECRYCFSEKKWRTQEDYSVVKVIAWCEIPQFKE